MYINLIDTNVSVTGHGHVAHLGMNTTLDMTMLIPMFMLMGFTNFK